MADAEQLRNDMNKNHNELKEQNMKQLQESKERDEKLTNMILNLTTHQTKAAEDTAQRFDNMEKKQDSLENRIEKIEKGGTEKSEHTFRGQHMEKIEQAKFGIKVLGMRDKVSEISAKTHLEQMLNLTKTTMNNMGISQAFRLGKNPEKEGDPCPPVIIVFTTTEMVEIILNAARSEGLGNKFKEHIAEEYAKVYAEFIRIGQFLRESKQFSYRLRFEEHTLQLQVKPQTSDRYKIIKKFTPQVALNTLAEIEELEGEEIAKPTEEDTRKVTIVLGSTKLNIDNPKEVPKEMIAEMSKEEQKAMEEAFKLNNKHMGGNRITVICKTRTDAIIIGNWKGVQKMGTYSLNPLPDCFTDITWNK